MSIEAAKAYFDKLQNDEHFARQLQEATVAARNKVVAQAGLPAFSEEELAEVNQDLSEAQLKQIVGGAFVPRPKYPR